MYIRKVQIARAIHLNPFYRYFPLGHSVRSILNIYKNYRYLKVRCQFE